jgi:hypothetical protein
MLINYINNNNQLYQFIAEISTNKQNELFNTKKLL